MTARAQDFLSAFEALAPTEQQEVAVEILRRSRGADQLSDESFTDLAAEVFQAYDAEEAAGAGH